MTAHRPHWEPESARTVTRWTIAAYACIVAALSSVFAMAAWGVVHDLRDARLMRLNTELNRLRSHASRTISMLQDSLAKTGEAATLDDLRDDEWLHSHWARTVPKDPSRLYGAVVDPKGLIVMHSTAGAEGKYLDLAWYERVVNEVGRDVLETDDPLLTGGQRAYDISLPIFYRDKQIGTYHSGFNRDWFETVAAESQERAKIRWIIVLLVMGLVVGTALVSLYHITRRATLLGQAVRLSRARRFAELGQLIGGIAHEIRNPLNAMRLNLHMLERYQQDGEESHHIEHSANGDDDGGDGSFDEPLDSIGIIQETNREIERVEELMKILLGYARPERANNDFVDVVAEIHATLRFLRPTMERSEMVVKASLPDGPRAVFIDRNRLRQIMLNLLNNAREATGPGGRIDVSIGSREERVEITVTDNGPGIPEADRERIFEPFFSTKELGTGLGLPLVRRFVEEAGGSIEYVPAQGTGACFRLTFPEAVRPQDDAHAVSANWSSVRQS
ncbi:MAG TPA: ATP-binding protein [Pirellulales bacterium]|jgi:signal transduction histidine kinase|nr:ATP-binding protein [Pirellulales bacterium]